MKRGILVLTFVALTAGVSAMGQSPVNGEWVGVWHTHVEGMPTGALTLATDTGQLGGTVVLDIVSREGGTPHVIVSDPHVLIGPRVEGGTLSFQVKLNRRDGSVVMAQFAVTHTGADKADIHCLNCGSNAPVVGLVRDR